MTNADLKTMSDQDLFNLQQALEAKYMACKTMDIVLLRKVDAELDARFN